MFAYHCNDDMKNGFYVEIGAGHPIESNNTYWLEKEHGWQGVSLDAGPDCVKAYNEIRSNKCILGDGIDFDWDQYFKENNVKNRIEYLSIDIDQDSGYFANYHALLNLPLTRYRFNVISIEHAGYVIQNEKVMNMQRDLLLSLGYNLLYRDNGDDIWVDQELNSHNGYDLIAAWHLEF
jgi:hypothetical protein